MSERRSCFDDLADDVEKALQPIYEQYRKKFKHLKRSKLLFHYYIMEGARKVVK